MFSKITRFANANAWIATLFILLYVLVLSVFAFLVHPRGIVMGWIPAAIAAAATIGSMFYNNNRQDKRADEQRKEDAIANLINVAGGGGARSTQLPQIQPIDAGAIIGDAYQMNNDQIRTNSRAKLESAQEKAYQALAEQRDRQSLLKDTTFTPALQKIVDQFGIKNIRPVE